MWAADGNLFGDGDHVDEVISIAGGVETFKLRDSAGQYRVLEADDPILTVLRLKYPKISLYTTYEV